MSCGVLRPSKEPRNSCGFIIMLIERVSPAAVAVSGMQAFHESTPVAALVCEVVKMNSEVQQAWYAGLHRWGRWQLKSQSQWLRTLAHASWLAGTAAGCFALLGQGILTALLQRPILDTGQVRLLEQHPIIRCAPTVGNSLQIPGLLPDAVVHGQGIQMRFGGIQQVGGQQFPGALQPPLWFVARGLPGFLKQQLQPP